MDNKVFIIDNGSAFIKADFSDKVTPSLIFPTVIGKPKYQNEFKGFSFDTNVFQAKKKKQQKFKKLGVNTINEMVGNRALQSPSIYNVEFPIENGQVTNYDDLLDIYNYIYFGAFKVEPSNYPLLLTDNLTSTTRQKEKLMEIALEALKVPIFGLSPQTNLTLKSMGLTTGLVIESGHGSTQVVAIVDDYLITKSADSSVFISGSNLSSIVQNYISRCNVYEIDSQRDFSLLEKLKAKFCEINTGSMQKRRSNISTTRMTRQTMFAQMYDEKVDKTKICELPDGSLVNMGVVPQLTDDMFFNCSVLGHEGLNLSEMAVNSIRNSDIDTRVELMKNILITGGNAKIGNLKKKLHKMICEELFENQHQIKFVSQSVDPQLAVWQGAGVMVALDSNFESKFWITKAEYEEEGLRLAKRFLHNK